MTRSNRVVLTGLILAVACEGPEGPDSAEMDALGYADLEETDFLDQDEPLADAATEDDAVLGTDPSTEVPDPFPGDGTAPDSPWSATPDEPDDSEAERELEDWLLGESDECPTPDDPAAEDAGACSLASAPPDVPVPWCMSVCESKKMIIGCDDRARGPEDGTETKSPWNMVGRLTNGCTGTLISDSYVLTAAHCLVNGDGSWKNGPIGFRLGESGASCSQKPFGTRYASAIMVPRDYVANTQSGTGKALDYGIVQLANPISGGKHMDVEYLGWNTVKDRQTTAIGYPYDKSPTNSAWFSKGGYAWDQPWRWIDGGEKGTVRISNDGAGGMSGGPLYVWYGNVRKLVGVFIGSPIDECKQGYVWASRITPNTIEHIENAKLFPPYGTTLDFFWKWRQFSGSALPPDVQSGC